MKSPGRNVLNLSQHLSIRDRYKLDPSDIAAHFDILQKEEKAGTPSTVLDSASSGDLYSPRPKLMTLMKEMQSSGELEGLDDNQLLQAFAARVNAELAREQRPDSDLPPFKPGPEFTEVMWRIDAARDAEGVPQDADETLLEFMDLSFGYLEKEALFPTRLVIEWMTNALATEGMTHGGRERLSTLLWSIYEHEEREFARIERNRAKRRRRRNKR